MVHGYDVSIDRLMMIEMDAQHQLQITLDCLKLLIFR